MNQETDALKLEACRAYARMINTLDYSCLDPWLNPELEYQSQKVLEVMRGKERYSEYIRGKIETIRNSGYLTVAEIAYTDMFDPGPCVIIAQGEEERWVATLLLKMKGNRIGSMVMCIIPSPYECRRTREQPGREQVPVSLRGCLEGIDTKQL